MLLVGFLPIAAIWLAELIPTNALYEQVQPWLRALPAALAEEVLITGCVLYALAWVFAGFLPKATSNSR